MSRSIFARHDYTFREKILYIFAICAGAVIIAVGGLISLTSRVFRSKKNAP